MTTEREIISRLMGRSPYLAGFLNIDEINRYGTRANAVVGVICAYCRAQARDSADVGHLADCAWYAAAEFMREVVVA